MSSPGASSSRSRAITLTCDLDSPGDPQRLHQPVHPTRADTKQVAGRGHAGQGCLGPARRQRPVELSDAIGEGSWLHAREREPDSGRSGRFARTRLSGDGLGASWLSITVNPR
jgi:hypothetical protein